MAHVKQVASTTQKPYSGLSRSVVIAIDVGTTFSGVRIQIQTTELALTGPVPSGILLDS